MGSARRAPLGEPLKHGSLVLSVAFHPNGRVAATAGTNGLVRFWDLATFKPLDRVVSHQAEVVHVCFNGDGSRLLTACRDGTAKFWDFESAKPIGPPMLHSAPIGVAALSPDGRLIAIATTENAVYLWDAATGKALGAPIPQPDQVYALAFDPNGNTLAVGSRDHAIRFWNVRTRSVARSSLFGHIAPITSLAYCPAGARIVSGADDNTVRVWDLATGETIGSPFEHRGSVVSIAFSPDGQSFATGSRDENARIWFAPKLPPTTAAVHSGRIFALDLSADGKYLLVGGEDHRARLYDAKTGPTDRADSESQRSRDRSRLQPRRPLGSLRQHGRRTPALERPRRRAARQADAAPSQTLPHRVPTRRPRDRLGLADGLVRFWDVTTCETIGTALAHPAPVQTLAYSPDGKVILTGCATTSPACGTPKPANFSVRSCAIKDRSRRRLQFRRPPDRHRRRRQHRPRLGCRHRQTDRPPFGAHGLDHGVGLSSRPQSSTPRHRLANMSTRLWGIDAGKSIGPALLQKGSVFGLAFRADGRVLYSAGTDKTVRAWEVPRPFPGEPKSLDLWAQTLTGMQLDPDGAARVLSAPEWHPSADSPGSRRRNAVRTILGRSLSPPGS